MLKVKKTDDYKNLKDGSTKKRKVKWWHIVIGVLLLLIIAMVVVFVNVSMRTYSKSKFVSTWDQLGKSTSSNSNLTASTDPSDNKSTINDSDFDRIKLENYPIIKVKQKDPDIENILLIGIDGGDPGDNAGHRSDSMIVVSINTKTNTVKMTSILRDIKAYFPDRKAWAKLNASYAYGGAGQVINIINYNFKLDIQKYILVNFSGFKNIIDAAGGLQIKVTNAEATQILGLSKGGTYNLSGTQALAYSRIRHIDSDFVRTTRQRTVLLTLFNKIKADNLLQKTAVGNQFLNYVTTNIPTTELFGKLLNLTSLVSGEIQQLQVPAADNGMYTIETLPVWYFDLNWDKEIQAISDFIYGKYDSLFHLKR